MSNECDFGAILAKYYANTEQEKRWQETCAALTLIKNTLQTDCVNDISGLESRIQRVANGIRNSLEREE